MPGFDHNLVNMIVTQATPHQTPVIAIDQYLVEFYDRVNSYWVRNESQLSDVTVFSSGGGYRDFLVKSALTSLNGVSTFLGQVFFWFLTLISFLIDIY